MPPKKHAVKGEPDFHTMSDEELRVYVDMIQHLIFSYEQCDKEKHKVLESIWKDLSNESTDRLLNSDVEVEHSASTPATLLRKVPKVRKSPVKRNI